MMRFVEYFSDGIWGVELLAPGYRGKVVMPCAWGRPRLRIALAKARLWLRWRKTVTD